MNEQDNFLFEAKNKSFIRPNYCTCSSVECIWCAEAKTSMTDCQRVLIANNYKSLNNDTGGAV